MRKLGTILARTIVVVFAFFVLYLYFPFASRLLAILLRHLAAAGDTRPLLGSYGAIAGSGGIIEIFCGLVFSLLILIVPPAFAVLLTWKTAKKISFRKKAGGRSRKDQEASFNGKTRVSSESQTSSTETALDGGFSGKCASFNIKEEPVPSYSEPAEVVEEGKGLSGEAYRDFGSQDWFRLGKDLFDAGRHQDAVRAYTKAIDLSPDGLIYFYRGMAHHRIGNTRQVMKDLKAAANLGHEISRRFLSSKGIAW